MHGFGVSHRMYGARGKENDTWTSRSINNYARRQECLIDQYGDFQMPNGRYVSITQMCHVVRVTPTH